MCGIIYSELRTELLACVGGKCNHSFTGRLKSGLRFLRERYSRGAGGSPKPGRRSSTLLSLAIAIKTEVRDGKER